MGRREVCPDDRGSMFLRNDFTFVAYTRSNIPEYTVDENKNFY